MLLLPDDFLPDDFSAQWTGDLAAALATAATAKDVTAVRLNLTQSGKECGALSLVWPLGDLCGFTAGPPEPSKPVNAPPALVPRVTASPEVIAAVAALPTEPISVDSLPPYTRSLLRIRVPVMVTLASKRQPLSRIVELVPGSIIQFNKSCDDMLDLEVAGHTVAKGECVKVGDKFGLRLTSITLPPERFARVR